ncbi:hypothetical protein MXB_2112 [Myxobolus squamalis]|nr:hypothetical protein MXB_2112 [Myxobolus squamalis]
MEENAIIKLFKTRTYVRMSAPMVRYSKYEVDVAFTPMILADSFIKSDKAREADFCTDTSKKIIFTSDDRPLIVQFGANDGPSLVKAISYICNFCDGVDINCGCPQNWVTDMGMGAKLLTEPEVVEDMLKHARQNFPMLSRSIKIRLLDDVRLSKFVFAVI